MVRVGTAGWTLPRAVQDRFAGADAHLARYARVLNAAEINSSFYRSHRASTWARWAASVPPDFRFAVKLPKAITHEHRLVGADDLLDAFLLEIAPLGAKLGCLLVQFPGSFELAPQVVDRFFGLLRARHRGPVVVEPRHAGWFTREAAALLKAHALGRVGADPARVPAAGKPGGAGPIAYWRLHGSPRMYWSPYDDGTLDRVADALREVEPRVEEAWCIFDNTASGAAAANALALQDRVRASSPWSRRSRSPRARS